MNGTGEFPISFRFYARIKQLIDLINEFSFIRISITNTNSMECFACDAKFILSGNVVAWCPIVDIL